MDQLWTDGGPPAGPMSKSTRSPPPSANQLPPRPSETSPRDDPRVLPPPSESSPITIREFWPSPDRRKVLVRSQDSDRPGKARIVPGHRSRIVGGKSRMVGEESRMVRCGRTRRSRRRSGEGGDRRPARRARADSTTNDTGPARSMSSASAPWARAAWAASRPGTRHGTRLRVPPPHAVQAGEGEEGEPAVTAPHQHRRDVRVLVSLGGLVAVATTGTSSRAVESRLRTGFSAPSEANCASAAREPAVGLHRHRPVSRESGGLSPAEGYPTRCSQSTSAVCHARE